MSLKRHPSAAFGYFVQPELFLYQHRKRRGLLEMAAEEFGSGTIYPKPGNEYVLVLRIGNRAVLKDRVVPFFRQYMRYSHRVEDYEIFAHAVELLDRGAQRTREGLVSLVRLAYAINDGGKHRRIPEAVVLDRILRGHTLNAPARAKIWSDLHGDMES